METARCKCVAWAGVGRRQAGMIAIARSLSAPWPFWCHADRKGLGMTSKAAFSPEERKAVLEGAPSAGMIVVTAARGGSIRLNRVGRGTAVESRSFPALG